MAGRMNRRQFAQLVAAAAGAGLFGARCAPPSQTDLADGGFPDVGGADDGLPDVSLTPKTAIVVGSGYGGAVAALRLAEAGVQVTVIERGRAWPVQADGETFCTNLRPDGRSTWKRTQTVTPLGPSFRIDSSLGVLAREDFDNMQVYTGAGVGGGSLVYGCMTVQPQRSLFDAVFAGQLSYDELDTTWYPLVQQMLQASPIPEDLFQADFYQMSRRFQATGDQAGIRSLRIDLATDWEAVRREMRGEARESAIVGDLLYGANSGYKNSLDRTYLPAAVATGNTQILVQSEVTGIARTLAGGWVVFVEETDRDGTVVATHEYESDLLFLAAGSVGTTRLLLNAQREGTVTGLENALGTNWGNNGNVMFMRSEIETDTGTRQANPPVLAADYTDNPHVPILVENAPFPIGFECNCLLQLAVSADPTRGRFGLNQDGSLALEWPEDGSQSTVDAVQAFSDQMARVDGGRMGSSWLQAPTRHFTYHPLGGAAMGSVCDTFGRVRNAPGLYVVDSALIPGAVGCANPSWTIAAVAERALATIVRQDLG